MNTTHDDETTTTASHLRRAPGQSRAKCPAILTYASRPVGLSCCTRICPALQSCCAAGHSSSAGRRVSGTYSRAPLHRRTRLVADAALHLLQCEGATRTVNTLLHRGPVQHCTACSTAPHKRTWELGSDRRVHILMVQAAGSRTPGGERSAPFSCMYSTE